jgi:predicted nucleic acid-binding protein
MTTLIDATALIALHIDCSQRATVVEALNADTVWVASALTLTESLAAIHRITDDEVLRRELEDSIRHTWDFLHVVPVDQRILDEANIFTSQQPVGVSTAIHLATAQRLGNPLRYVTFDPNHIPVALSLGIDIISQ